MKEIYIVLAHTGTILSRMIKLYTRKKYTHSSIALEKDLKCMYSFGRLNPYNPFWGGFVIEGKNIGTFKRFKNTHVGVYSMEVTDEQYENIKNEIERFNKEKKEYKFNILGMFLTSVNIRLKRKNYFYCAEFVKYILESQNIEANLPDIIKPNDFTNLENIKLIYEGKLRKYNLK